MTPEQAVATVRAEVPDLLARAKDILHNVANRGDAGPHHLISDMAQCLDALAAQPLMGVQRGEDVARALSIALLGDDVEWKSHRSLADKFLAALPQTQKEGDTTLYLERSAVRSIIIGVADEHVHVTEGILADIDQLPLFRDAVLVKADAVLALPHTGQPQEGAVAEWFKLHDAYHKASNAYNARLVFVQAERARDNWEPTVHAEYRILNDAQRAAIAAAETLYQKLSAAPASPRAKGDHERETPVEPIIGQERS